MNKTTFMLALRPAAASNQTRLKQRLMDEHDIRRAFKHVNTKKSAEPDGISWQVLKLCANQITLVVMMMSNLSLAQSVISTCFKKSIIILVPNQTRPTSLNNYCPVALISMVLKRFEWMVKSYICSSLHSTKEPLQIAKDPNDQPKTP